jgi:hypothetical protein
MSDVTFSVTLTDHEWDSLTGGWRCDALFLPHASVASVFANGERVDASRYSIEQQFIRWAGGDQRPDAITVRFSVANVALTPDQEVELKHRQEENTLSLRREELKQSRRQMLVTAGVALTTAGLSSFVAWSGARKGTVKDAPAGPAPLPSKQIVGNCAAVGSRSVQHVSLQDLPDDGADTHFQMVRDICIWDLRGWQPVRNGAGSRFSPANFINYLHVVRKRPDGDSYKATFSTSGSGIDLHALTHSDDVMLADDADAHLKRYVATADVAHERVGSEFLLALEGTVWEGFRNDDQEDVATYTDKDISRLSELVIVVFFPETKRFTDYQLLHRPSGQRDYAPYTAADARADQIGSRFIYWNVTNRLPDCAYRIKWSW